MNDNANVVSISATGAYQLLHLIAFDSKVDVVGYFNGNCTVIHENVEEAEPRYCLYTCIFHTSDKIYGKTNPKRSISNGKEKVAFFRF